MVDSVGGTHHVRLGDSYLLVHPNSYTKRSAPAFGGRFSGGDPAYDNLAFWQHWAQSCWIGGMGRPDWEDDSMYDYGVGVDTSQHDIIGLARGIATGGTGYALDSAERQVKRRFLAYDGSLYALTVTGGSPGKIHKYTESTDTWAQWKSFGDSLWAGAFARFSGDMYVGTSGSKIRKYNSNKWTQINKPKGRTETPRMMQAYRNRLYVGFGRRIYRLKPNDKWDGNAVFFNGPGVDDYIDAEFHQGFLYMASRNGHIVRTDGNQTFDIHQFGGHMQVRRLLSHDGKLFISAAEWYDDEDIGEGVLYQMSGAAVTEIARWGASDRVTASSAMTEVARRMFYGAPDLLGVSETEHGFGVAVYDVREDSHSLFAVERDVTTYPDNVGDGKGWLVDDIIYWGGRFYIAVRGYGIFSITYEHRDLAREIATFDNSWEGTIAASNDEGGTLVSSEFDAGTPGLEKIWRKVSVTADLLDDGSVVHVAYSVDGGRTWTDVGSLTKTSSATRYTKDFFLEDIKSARFKYKLQLDTDNTAYTPFVRSVVVSFLPHPEPNWMWQFTAVLAEKARLLDGTAVVQDPDTLRAALETAFRDNALVYFQDVDGTEWVNDASTEKPGVLISDISFHAPFIGASSAGDIEYQVQIQLIEAVEAY